MPLLYLVLHMKYKPGYILFYIIIGLMLAVAITTASAQTIAPKKEYAQALMQLTGALLKRQNNKPADANYGGIWCAYDRLYHTRAAEAMYPLAIAWQINHDTQYLQAAINAGNWLIRQQQPNGSWKETPEEWTGTSTDQLLMMFLTYPHVEFKLSPTEKQSWNTTMRKAADYLKQVMSPEFASINYVATTSATLAKAGQFFNNKAYTIKAHELAHRTINKMDDDGFINGEGGRSYKNKSGVDLGYDMEMSLWGLGYYAKITQDNEVTNAVKHALKNHVYFIYPDGSMDGTWGIRSNKWTTYGSATSDGCMALFSMFADDDPVYANAGVQNLRYIQTCIKDGVLGFGPQHFEIFKQEMCIYPTFTKAKNIAFAWELEHRDSRPQALLPTQKTGWIKYFKTLDVVEVRTKNFMATITGYNYKDYAGRSKSKYMHRPAGGVISNLWVKGYGYVQASSQTVYSRPEPMSFPEAPGVISLTPRIEYTDSTDYFTNLYSFDCRLAIDKAPANQFKVSANGELSDKEWLAGGVAYHINYTFGDNSIQKSIRLTYHDAQPLIKIVEPFIDYKLAEFRLVDNHTVNITAKNKRFQFKILSGNVKLILGENADKYWWPYPALEGYPLTMLVSPPLQSNSNTITYKLTLLP